VGFHEFKGFCDGHWCRRWGCNRTTNIFDLVKIQANSVEILAKYVKTFAQSLYVCAWILQKWHPITRCRRFFSFGGHVFILFFSLKLGEIWASSKMVLELCFDFNKCTQRE